MLVRPISVALRPLTNTDLEPIHELLSDWNVVRFMLLPHCETKAESEKCLRDLIAENPGAPWHSEVRAIQMQNSGEMIGICGVSVLQGSETGEIWYLLRPDFWGRGITTEAARMLLRIGFAEMKLHRIFAMCLPENPASARVLEKIGMRKEGCQRKSLRIHGEWRDCSVYAILRDEWAASIESGRMAAAVGQR